ncbi:MAG TPA: helix-turn-helix transcriptional regulator [Gemmatimonadales bacterium]|jgi:transcriptional regulator with XRE-family HTH domain
MRELFLLWGRRIEEARKALGLTQVQLAEAVGVDQTTISQWERGRVVPRDEMRIALANALGTTVAELLPYPEPESVS